MLSTTNTRTAFLSAQSKIGKARVMRSKGSNAFNRLLREITHTLGPSLL